MVLFTCPSGADARLFAPGQSELVLPGKAKPFDVDAVRQILAGTSDQSADRFQVSRGIFFVSNGPSPRAQQTDAGNGYVLVMSQAAPAAQVNFCAIAEGKIAGPLARVALSESDLLLVRIFLDGAPFIMAIHATINIDDSTTHAMRRELHEEQAAFGESLMRLSMKTPIAMRMTPIPAGAEECLELSAGAEPRPPAPRTSPDPLRYVTGGERALLWEGASPDSSRK